MQARGRQVLSTPDGCRRPRHHPRLWLSARKSLGQNFLLDFNLTRRIARAAGPLEGTTVVEIGPGPGGLTRALLLEGASRVIAIEKDERCLPALSDIADVYPGRIEIVAADAREVDYGGLGLRAPTRIVANLPYARRHAPPHRLAQDRAMAALVRSARAQRFSARWRCASWPSRAARTTGVSPCSPNGAPPLAFCSPFRPPPSRHAPRSTPLWSSFVPKEVPQPACDVAALEWVTAAASASGARCCALPAAAHPRQRSPAARAGIDPKARAEELEIADFCRIANALQR